MLLLGAVHCPSHAPPCWGTQLQAYKVKVTGKAPEEPKNLQYVQTYGFFLSVQTKYEYEGLDPFESKPPCTCKTTRFIKALSPRQKPEEGVKK